MLPIEQKQIFYLLEGPGINQECLQSTEKKLKALVKNPDFIKFDSSYFTRTCSPGTLVVSGGNASEQMSDMGFQGLSNARTFIHNTNQKYIGICAGAYLAIKPCLGLVDSRYESSSSSQSNQKLRIRPVAVSEGLIKKTYTFSTVYFGGPEFLPSYNEQVLATFTDNYTVAVISRPGILLTSYHWEFPSEFDFDRWKDYFEESVTYEQLAKTVKTYQTVSDQVVKTYLSHLKIKTTE